MKKTHSILAILVLAPVAYVLAAAGGAPAVPSYQAELQGLRVKGDSNNDGVLDHVDVRLVEGAIGSPSFDPLLDHDLDGRITEGDHILLLLWLQGRKSVALDPADTNADGVVDAADAQQFVDQFAAGSQLANYTGYQNAGTNDPLDNGDLTAFANRLAVVIGGN